MPSRHQAKLQNRFHLKAAKEQKVTQQTSAALAKIGSGYRTASSDLRFTNNTTFAMGCLLLLATITSAAPVAHPKRGNPLQDFDKKCVSPTLLNTDDTLTIYQSRSHFFVELICQRCDRGKFYADRHGIQMEFRKFVKETDGTNTVRDEYFTEKNPGISFYTMKLTADNAKKALAEIRKMHASIQAKTLKYITNQFDCIDYVQRIYQAAGGIGSFTQKIKEHLFGVVGAVADIRQNGFQFSSFLSMFFSGPKMSADEFKAQEPCRIQNDRQSFFRKGICLQTPAGAQVPEDYRTPVSLTPDCEVRKGECYYNWR